SRWHRRTNGIFEAFDGDGNRKITSQNYEARCHCGIGLGPRLSFRLLPLALCRCEGFVGLPLVLRVGHCLALGLDLRLTQGYRLDLSLALGFFFSNSSCGAVCKLSLIGRASLPAGCNLCLELRQVPFRLLPVFPRLLQRSLGLLHGRTLGLSPGP